LAAFAVLNLVSQMMARHFPKEVPRHTCANVSRRQKSVRGWVIRDDTPRQRKVMGISFINKPEKQPYADKRMP
jgi:hypothetical protein